MIKEFKQFLLHGNVVDLAVGVIIGGAFGVVVSALVADILTPLISTIVSVPNVGGLSFTLLGSHFLYGHFINAIFSFILIVAAVFFLVVKPMNNLIERSHRGPPADPTTKKCRECLSEIPLEATRCAHCTQLVQ